MTKAEILEKIEDIYESAGSKLPDIEMLNTLSKFIKKEKEEEEEAAKSSAVIWVFAIVGVIVVVACVAYFVYRYFEPDYLEDF